MSAWYQGVEAVLLDSGGVLLMPSADGIRTALSVFSVPLPGDELCWRSHYWFTGELDRIMRDGPGSIDAAAPGNWRVLAGHFGLAEDEQDQAAAGLRDVYIRDPWVPVPGAGEALRALETAGFAMAIVSNAYGTMEQYLADVGICSVDGCSARVAAVIDSHLVGVAKPHRAIFDMGVAAVGKDPMNCVYVGDTMHFDVEGAEGADLRPVHMDPPGFCRARSHPHVGSLAELVRWLTQ